MTTISPVPAIDSVIREAADSALLGQGLRAMQARASEFSSTLEMQLAGVCANPMARAILEARLDEVSWRDRRQLTTDVYPEVIIGGGLHAAIYCAVRVLSGFPKPAVLEATARPGGAFAVSKCASFYANSSNRPGLVGQPGDVNASLNYLPGALIQPAALSMNEYHTNADIALVVRLMLAQYAKVYTNSKAEAISSFDAGRSGRVIQIMLTSGEIVSANRVLEATGLGVPELSFCYVDGDRSMTFAQFMARMDEDFPMRGMERVAVIGSGDSARCAVEALLGIGPSRHMSMPVLDWVRDIDWYSTKLPQTCREWRGAERGRYQRIGSYLPSDSATEPGRLRIRREAARIQRGFGGVLVNGRTYSHAVLCAGNSLARIVICDNNAGGQPTIARRLGSRQYWQIGPVANIEWVDREREDGLSQVEANKVAIFRLAPRTAALASQLAAC